jgi:SulP family sulfate permease
VLAQLGYVFAHLPEINPTTVIMAAALLVLLFVGTRLLPRLPWTLIAMLLAAAVASLGNLERYGLQLVGPIPTGWPRLSVPDVSWTEAASLLPAAVGLAVVGYSDTVLTGHGFAAKMGHRINPDRELVALGVANVAAGLSQGFPVSASASRTAIAHSLSARTQLYSLVMAAVIALTMAYGRPILAAFPWAGLGAVVVYAGTRMIDIGELRRTARFAVASLRWPWLLRRRWLPSGCCGASLPRSRCPVPICCGASPGPTTPYWAICQTRLECTTSTIALTDGKCLAW